MPDTRSIEADLRRAASMYLSSEALSRNDLAVFVREAIRAGMTLDEIARLTAVPLEDLAELSR